MALQKKISSSDEMLRKKYNIKKCSVVLNLKVSNIQYKDQLERFSGKWCMTNSHNIKKRFEMSIKPSAVIENMKLDFDHIQPKDLRVKVIKASFPKVFQTKELHDLALRYVSQRIIDDAKKRELCVIFYLDIFNRQKGPAEEEPAEMYIVVEKCILSLVKRALGSCPVVKLKRICAMKRTFSESNFTRIKKHAGKQEEKKRIEIGRKKYIYVTEGNYELAKKAVTFPGLIKLVDMKNAADVSKKSKEMMKKRSKRQKTFKNDINQETNYKQSNEHSFQDSPQSYEDLNKVTVSEEWNQDKFITNVSEAQVTQQLVNALSSTCATRVYKGEHEGMSEIFDSVKLIENQMNTDSVEKTHFTEINQHSLQQILSSNEDFGLESLNSVEPSNFKKRKKAKRKSKRRKTIEEPSSKRLSLEINDFISRCIIPSDTEGKNQEEAFPKEQNEDYSEKKLSSSIVDKLNELQKNRKDQEKEQCSDETEHSFPLSFSSNDNVTLDRGPFNTVEADNFKERRNLDDGRSKAIDELYENGFHLQIKNYLSPCIITSSGTEDKCQQEASSKEQNTCASEKSGVNKIFKGLHEEKFKDQPEYETDIDLLITAFNDFKPIDELRPSSSKHVNGFVVDTQISKDGMYILKAVVPSPYRTQQNLDTELQIVEDSVMESTKSSDKSKAVFCLDYQQITNKSKMLSLKRKKRKVKSVKKMVLPEKESDNDILFKNISL